MVKIDGNKIFVAFFMVVAICGLCSLLNVFFAPNEVPLRTQAQEMATKAPTAITVATVTPKMQNVQKLTAIDPNQETLTQMPIVCSFYSKRADDFYRDCECTESVFYEYISNSGSKRDRINSERSSLTPTVLTIFDYNADALREIPPTPSVRRGYRVSLEYTIDLYRAFDCINAVTVRVPTLGLSIYTTRDALETYFTVTISDLKTGKILDDFYRKQVNVQSLCAFGAAFGRYDLNPPSHVVSDNC